MHTTKQFFSARCLLWKKMVVLCALYIKEVKNIMKNYLYTNVAKK